jgi:hypothetical protein
MINMTYNTDIARTTHGKLAADSIAQNSLIFATLLSAEYEFNKHNQNEYFYIVPFIGAIYCFQYNFFIRDYESALIVTTYALTNISRKSHVKISKEKLSIPNKERFRVLNQKWAGVEQSLISSLYMTQCFGHYTDFISETINKYINRDLAALSQRQLEKAFAEYEKSFYEPSLALLQENISLSRPISISHYFDLRRKIQSSFLSDFNEIEDM